MNLPLLSHHLVHVWDQCCCYLLQNDHLKMKWNALRLYLKERSEIITIFNHFELKRKDWNIIKVSLTDKINQNMLWKIQASCLKTLKNSKICRCHSWSIFSSSNSMKIAIFLERRHEHCKDVHCAVQKIRRWLIWQCAKKWHNQKMK